MNSPPSPVAPIESVADSETYVGEQIRGLRLSRNLSQKLVAEQAGISEKAVRRLEAGIGSTLSTLIAVLKVLGRDDWTKTLAPVATINPLSLPVHGETRQRASAARPGRRETSSAVRKT